MSTYFIGDVHGCYDELKKLLQKINFDRDKDHLVFVGDLINRGPKSLQVLRFVRSLGNSATVILGNHDISFVAYMVNAYHGKGSDFPELSQAEDAHELAEWLRHQSILYNNKGLDVIVTHAGVLPRWSLKKAIKHAKKVEKKLRSKKYADYLSVAYQEGSDKWHKQKSKYDKFRYRLNAFTRLRYCYASGEANYNEKCVLGKQKKNTYAWFQLREKCQNDGTTRIIFGHWAALGYYKEGHAICLDSGCVWGGALTALTKDKSGWKSIQVESQQKKFQ